MVVSTVEELLGAIGNERTVYLKEGTYFLAHTLELQAHNLTLQAKKGEKVVLSGGRPLNCQWESYRDGIFMCQLEKGLKFTQLYVNGRLKMRARYPKKGNWLHLSKKKTTWPHTEMYYDEFTDRVWKKPEEAVIHIFSAEYWGNLQWEIEEIDYENKKIRFGKGGFQINDILQGKEGTGIDHRSKYFIENVFEELTEPGEWYYDRESGVLYYMPEEGVNLETADVTASSLKELVRMTNCRNVTISGVEFCHTEPVYLDLHDAPSMGDWTVARSGAVYMENCERCRVENSMFQNLGGNGVFLNLHNKDNSVSHNEFSDIGESAVCLVGAKHLSLGTQKKAPVDNIVSHNRIHNIGLYGKQTAGVFISVAARITVSYNHIHNVPRAGICINDGTWGGHVIEYNDIHDTVQETCDHGPFNSWGRDRFWCFGQSHFGISHEAGNVLLDAKETTVIRNNRFEDYRGWGIDLDDGSSNYHVYNNLCIGISIKLREGDYRVVENNIFINGANPPGFHIGYEGNHDRFERNIVMMNSAYDNPEVDINFQKMKSGGAVYELIGPPEKGKWLEMDNNLFYSDLGEFRAVVNVRPLAERKKVTYNMEAWNDMGYDLHSVYADPHFCDAAAGDFRLKEDSPAFKLGFKEFEVMKQH